MVSSPQSGHDGFDAEAGVLNSWKEIASFMKRGIRTVQRWERELGLPVRRVGNRRGNSVFAFRNELNAWLAGGNVSAGADGHAGPTGRAA